MGTNGRRKPRLLDFIHSLTHSFILSSSLLFILVRVMKPIPRASPIFDKLRSEHRSLVLSESMRSEANYHRLGLRSCGGEISIKNGFTSVNSHTMWFTKR